MKLQKNKSICAIALILMMTVATLLMIGIPNASAAKITVVASISVSPKIVGLGNSVVVNAFISPMPNATAKKYDGIYVVFTKPDGNEVTKGPLSTYGEGTLYFSYTPDKLGNWSVMMTWTGDDSHEGADSESFAFTVQSESLPTISSGKLPSGFWSHPINAENTDWYSISGGWFCSSYRLDANYNASSSSYNPYSKAPTTSHVLWKDQPLIGGLVGGEFGGDRYSATYQPSVYTVIMGGKAYYASHDGIHCLDLITGEELWNPAVDIPGSAAGGTEMTYFADLFAIPGPTTYRNRDTPQPMSTAYLWTRTASNVVKYDASTGALLMNLPAPTNQSFGYTTFDPNADCSYSLMPITYSNGTSGMRLVKWNTVGTIMKFAQRIIWDVPFVSNYDDMYLWGDTLVFVDAWGTDPSVITAVSTANGEQLWSITTNEMLEGVGAVGCGKVYWAASDRKIHAFDLDNGLEVWESETADYPWGVFWAYNMGVDENNVYAQCYDGHLYAFDVETGNTAWKFYSGDTADTPYNTWPFWGSIAIADGKVYAGTSEHTPSQPMIKGCKMFCIDAATGNQLWNISFASGGGKAIADGKLIASNEYDSTMYAFDKGQTATTIAASPKVATSGSSVLIEGTVTDLSPAQPGTPAMADEYMSAWMEYLHMQKTMPTDATGVQVHLTAVGPDGKTEEIGSVTSNIKGNFAIAWTPSTTGLYTITATFEGTDSYYSSDAETAFVLSATAASPIVTAVPTQGPTTSLTASPSTAPTPPGTQGIGTEVYVAVAAIAVIVAVALVALFLRRRK